MKNQDYCTKTLDCPGCIARARCVSLLHAVMIEDEDVREVCEDEPDLPITIRFPAAMIASFGEGARWDRSIGDDDIDISESSLADADTPIVVYTTSLAEWRERMPELFGEDALNGAAEGRAGGRQASDAKKMLQ